MAVERKQSTALESNRVLSDASPCSRRAKLFLDESLQEIQLWPPSSATVAGH
jgi:hypothetical protein